MAEGRDPVDLPAVKAGEGGALSGGGRRTCVQPDLRGHSEKPGKISRWRERKGIQVARFPRSGRDGSGAESIGVGHRSNSASDVAGARQTIRFGFGEGLCRQGTWPVYNVAAPAAGTLRDRAGKVFGAAGVWRAGQTACSLSGVRRSFRSVRDRASRLSGWCVGIRCFEIFR